MDPNLMIKKFIESELINDEEHQGLTESDELITTGIIDSLGLIKSLQFISDTLSINIDDREIVPENFNTLDAISNLVKEKMS